jgi:sulfane dehydrogenase subunit SoxC
MDDGQHPISRRALITGAAVTAGSAILGGLGVVESEAGTVPSQPSTPPDPSSMPGAPTSAVGARSPFEQPARSPVGMITGPSYSPLQRFTGTITPSDLHFERHHSGVPAIDPARWELLVHGLVDRPLVFTLAELRRLPSVTRTCFLECSGNGRAAYRTPKREMTPQDVDGLTGNSEWTGVALGTLLREAGVRRDAKWMLAEGGDSNKLSRSIPIEKALDDAIVAWAQNGEAIRPANGYPVRLVLPGWEANTCIKWLRRLELVEAPAMFRDETSKYTDPLADGTVRQFSFVMDAKSIITSPAHPDVIPSPGWLEISGLAWTGRGKIARVDVSTDGGGTWTAAELQAPVLPCAHTRFRLMWRWDGKSATLMSRAMDETGYVQPTLDEFRKGRGRGTDFHFNAIRSWSVEPGGRVFFAVEV